MNNGFAADGEDKDVDLIVIAIIVSWIASSDNSLCLKHDLNGINDLKYSRL